MQSSTKSVFFSIFRCGSGFEKMKSLLNIFIFCLLASTLFYQPATCGKVLNIKEIGNLAYKVINLSLKFVDSLVPGDDSETANGPIKKLLSAFEKLYNKLDYSFHEVERQPYKIVLSRHTDKIESCKNDHKNMLQQPSSIAAIENFKKCDDIMHDARAIGRYLSGHSLIDLKPILEYYMKDNICNGLQIKNMFQYLYTFFIDGCNIAVTHERITFNQSSTLYKDECIQMVDDIESYTRYFFGRCIKASCSSFYEQVEKLLKGKDILNVSSANKALENNFPWFQFLVIESSSAHSSVENNGTFPANSHIFAIKNIYHVFWADSFASFAENKTTENDTFVNVTISICDYLDSSYGMNLSQKGYVYAKLITFVGFRSNNTIDTCKYEESTSRASSVEKHSFDHIFIFVFAALFLYYHK